MRLVRFCVVAAALATASLSAPTSANTTTAGPASLRPASLMDALPRRPVPVPALNAGMSPEEAGAAWAESVLSTLERQAPSGRRVSAAEFRGRTATWTVAVEDLNGDDVPDVTTATSGTAGPSYAVHGVEAINGVDGSTLWTAKVALRPVADCSRPCRSSMSWQYVVPTRVGAGGRPGVVVVTLSASRDDLTDDEHITANLVAIGPDGSQLWQETREGTFSFGVATIAADDVPLVAAHLDALPGGAGDWLVQTINGRDVLNLTVDPWVATFEVVDGTDGASHPAGTAEGERVWWASRWLSRVQPVPDLSGDGLDDYLDYESDGDVAAYRGADRHPLWSSETLVDGSPTPVGDTTGDGRGDLLFVRWSTDPNETDGREPEEDRTAARPPQAGATLVDGATGEALWQRPARWGIAAPDMDGDGIGEVGLLRADGPRDSLELSYEVVSQYNLTLHSVSHTLSEALPERNTFLDGWLGMAGDLQDDGTDDLYAMFGVVTVDYQSYDRGDGESYSYPVYRFRSLALKTLDGGTGNVLRTDAYDWTLDAAVDGAGDDTALLDRTDDALTVTVQHGDTGDAIWSASIPGRYDDVSLFADRFVGSAGADVLVHAYAAERGTRLTLLSGTDGAARWTRDFGSLDRPHEEVTEDPEFEPEPEPTEEP